MKIREIPFLAMGGEYDQDDLDAVIKVVSQAIGPEGNFFPLPEENDFQVAIAQHEGAEKAVVVNSCGTALDCCMMALDIQPGDEVITTPLTFVCTAGTAIARGAQVKFADIDPITMNLSPESVRARITDKTKAIIAVHFTGLVCDVDAFDNITKETGIPVIYDAAHAIGAKLNGQPIGDRGLASCYSFQSNKNMTCLGEGGAITTNDLAFAEKVRQLKTFGYVYGGPSLKVVEIGFNYRMTKVQCAVGLTQLQKVGRLIKKRQDLMTSLSSLLQDVSELILPYGHGPGHASHIYVIRLNTDKVNYSTPEFVAHLKNTYKVSTGKHYPAVWSWEALQKLGYTSEGCPIAKKACEQVATLPVFTHTTPDDIEYIAWAVKATLHDLK
jgi:perosamine synthetase